MLHKDEYGEIKVIGIVRKFCITPVSKAVPTNYC